MAKLTEKIRHLGHSVKNYGDLLSSRFFNKNSVKLTFLIINQSFKCFHEILLEWEWIFLFSVLRCGHFWKFFTSDILREINFSWNENVKNGLFDILKGIDWTFKVAHFETLFNIVYDRYRIFGQFRPILFGRIFGQVGR